MDHNYAVLPPTQLTRRGTLYRLGAGFVTLALGTRRSAAQDGVSKLYDGLESSKFLTDLKVETRIADDKVFTEGPAVDRQGHLYFTNVPVNKILKWDGKSLSVFRENSNAANGLLFDRHGRLLACEGNGRVTRTDLRSGERTVLADAYRGFPLGAPNDLTQDAQGRTYFTSRLPNTDPDKGNVNSVYRIDPDGSLHRILHLPEIHMPNGIATSPDDHTLYLVESDGGENRNRCIRAFDLATDGTVSRPRTVIDFYPGRSADGMRVDAEGNLYLAAGLHRRRGSSETLDTRPGIHVVSPAGKLLAFVETPEDTITNCAFGGPDLRTLYVTCGTYLLSLRTRIPGKPSYRPEM